jgi:hypothetical protein
MFEISSNRELIRMSRQVEANPPLAFQVTPFCRRLGISRATFYKLKKLGKIHTIKIAGRVLVTAAEAERLLKEGAR